MEVAGFAITIVALASLFDTCLQCFDVLETGRNLRKEYQILIGHWGLLRTRFRIWGEIMCLAKHQDHQTSSLIHHPEIQSMIHKSLEGIKTLFEDTEVLVDSYGLKPPRAVASPAVTFENAKAEKRSWHANKFSDAFNLILSGFRSLLVTGLCDLTASIADLQKQRDLSFGGDSAVDHRQRSRALEESVTQGSGEFAEFPNETRIALNIGLGSVSSFASEIVYSGRPARQIANHSDASQSDEDSPPTSSDTRHGVPAYLNPNPGEFSSFHLDSASLDSARSSSFGSEFHMMNGSTVSPTRFPAEPVEGRLYSKKRPAPSPLIVSLPPPKRSSLARVEEIVETLPSHNEDVGAAFSELRTFMVSDPTIWGVPNALLGGRFRGRKKELELMRQALESAGYCILQGQAGAGKTQVAIKYASTYHRANPSAHIFWLTVSTSTLLHESVENILALTESRARLSGQDQTTSSSPELSLGNPEWLMVVDDVQQDMLQELRDFLPSSDPRGQVLLTTRSQTVAGILKTEHVNAVIVEVNKSTG